MYRFNVSFWWSTDCRCDQVVEANSELAAIVLAMHYKGLDQWCTDQDGDFKIIIRRARQGE